MPDAGLTDGGWGLPERLRVLRPEAVARLEAANALSERAVSPPLLDLVRRRVGALIGNHPAPGAPDPRIDALADYHRSSLFSAAERDCLAFAEQFVIDVSALTSVDVSRLAGHLGDGEVRAFVTALYITECTQRLGMVSAALLDDGVRPAPRWPDPHNGAAGRPAPDAGADLRRALASYQDAVVRGDALDAVVTEMVRLRCARTHNCRICQTLRLADARTAGVDETMTAKIDRYERSDLVEPIKTALRITDALISRPDTLGTAVVAAARASYTPVQLAELCLDITKWSTQKIPVALGTDGAESLPVNEDGVSFLSFASDGSVAGFSATLEVPAPAGS
jgi:alkylhydroperoxidase family enzyme